MNIRKHITFLVISLITISHYGQPGASHEIGFFVGAPSIQTDYGQRYDFMSNVGGNIGYGFGIVHYYQFSNYRTEWYQRTNFFREHFKIRSEISFATAKLNHHGKWLADDNTGKLTLMHGATKIINVGSALEFYYKDVLDYSLRYYNVKFNPYAGLGLQANFYKPEIYTGYGSGNWKVDDVLFPKWSPQRNLNDRVADDSKGITASVTFNIGTRYAISDNSDIFVDTRWHYFMSNYIDGLNAKVDENKYNDWMLFFQIGYVFYLD
ncbi:MAG TPA: hypothetical protein VFY09_07125 [Flavobacteriaceae bacterium]|nr:hypothetical protein [Flavobacteriaceae bacterium]HEX5743651.1 hypothetical protein [Flavobacteriaceae bacterium]